MTVVRPNVSDIGVVTPLPSPPSGSFDYSHALLPDGRLALVRTQVDLHAVRRDWRAAIEREWTPQPAILFEATARISIFDGRNETDVFDIPVGWIRLFNQFPDGRWIFASARANDDDLNGRILAANGAPAGAIHLGDGIRHLQCAADGTIWLGYFDEGVFSRVSFQGRKPLGSSGIANVSDTGALLFEANSDTTGFVDDCYALTLDGHTAWACTYSGFPIIRIAHGAIRSWANEISGVRALAVDGDLILLFGGYDDDEARLALVRLQENDAVLVGEAELMGCSREDLWTAQGCCDTLHVTSAGVWRRIRVRDFAAYLEEQVR